MSTVGARTRSRRMAVSQSTDPVPASAAVVPATEAPEKVPVGSTNLAARRRTKTTRAATLVAAGPILEKAPVPKRRVTRPLVSKKGKSTASNRKRAALQEADSEMDTADAIDYDGGVGQSPDVWRWIRRADAEDGRPWLLVVNQRQVLRFHRFRSFPRSRNICSRNQELQKEDVSILTQGQTLGTYDGTTDLDTFLNKFETMSKICGWTEEARKFYITTALTDTSAYIVREIGETDTSDDVIGKLKVAFGNEQQAERYRAELKRRRRGKGESLRASTWISAGWKRSLSQEVRKTSVLISSYVIFSWTPWGSRTPKRRTHYKASYTGSCIQRSLSHGIDWTLRCICEKW